VRRVTVCRKVFVNQQGYAYSGKQYFGTGAPLYFVMFEDGTNFHVRASSRAAAIKQARHPRFETLFESNAEADDG
jgi:hypothetical protein